MTFEDLANNISISIRGLGHPVALQYVKRAAQEFCEETEIWRDVKIDVDLSVGAEYYDIDFGKDISIVQIRKVYANQSALPQISNEDYLDGIVGQKDTTTNSSPSKCAFFAPSRIRFLPKNGKETKLSVYCSLKPTLSADSMPKDLLETYGEIIENGALRGIYLIKGRGYDDANMSRLCDRKFVLGCQKAKAAANKGNTMNNVMVDLSQLPMG